MNKKIYVGGISRNTSEEALREAFAQAGGVEDVWMKIDRETGLPAGFAFITMATPEFAEAAITMWHGKELDGRTLVVNEARPQEDRPRQGGFSPRGGGSSGGYGRDSRSSGKRNNRGGGRY